MVPVKGEVVLRSLFAVGWEGGAADFEFSRTTMEHHWRAGVTAVAETMRHDALLARNIVDGKTAAFDLVA